MERPSLNSWSALARKKDFYAGGLMILLGLFIALKGTTYQLGTPMHMGPGFFPTMLGVILVFLGIAIALSARSPSQYEGHEAGERILPENPQWLGWLCILAGPVLFIVLGSEFGMIPGTFACVFVSALGDRSATLKSSLVLATVVTAFGVLVFWYFLQVPMPLLTWGGGF